jgi:hypothetical protein
MVKSLIQGLIKPLSDLAGEFIEDKDKRNQFKANLYDKILENEGKFLEAQSNIITAEAKSDHWLTSTWRPITMLSFLGMVWSYWLGYTPENITPEILDQIFSLIQIGLGGYVVGRSGEKMIKEYKKK